MGSHIAFGTARRLPVDFVFVTISGGTAHNSLSFSFIPSLLSLGTLVYLDFALAVYKHRFIFICVQKRVRTHRIECLEVIHFAITPSHNIMMDTSDSIIETADCVGEMLWICSCFFLNVYFC